MKANFITRPGFIYMGGVCYTHLVCVCVYISYAILA